MRILYLSFLFLLFTIQSAFAQCTFHAIGHRGGSSYYFPENTLLSIEQGFIEGAWAIECDPRMTKDSVLMLMHDDYVDRTTNGHGYIAEMTKDEVKKLDAGSWKAPKFAGNKVPTLLEAVKIAQKYNRKLYLNMKVYQPNAIKKVLQESGAKPDIFIIDPDDTTKVREYHTLLPNTPLVYFGEPPSNIHDTAFYLSLKKQNVIAAEVPVIDIQDTALTWPKEYRNMLHAVGLEFWTYTINGHDLFEYAKNFGVDGLETDRAAMALSYFCDNKYGGFFPEKRITGQWDFNDSNLTGKIGSQLVLTGDTSNKLQSLQYGSTSEFNIPKINDTVAKVLMVPGLDSAHALRFFSNIAPAAEVSWKYCDCNLDYTLIMDILKPASTTDYIALFQTGSANSDDAELFINTTQNNGVGILDQYFGTIEDSVWYRLAFAFDLDENELKVYGNGNLWGTVSIPDNYKYRFCINNNWAIQMSHLFSDESNETSTLYVNSIQLRDYTMTSTEVAQMGSASASKISTNISLDSNICVTNIPYLQDMSIVEGSSIIVSALAGDTVNYRWQMNMHDGQGWQDFFGNNYANTANDSFQISLVTLAINGIGLRCKISNDCAVYTNETIVNVTSKPIVSDQIIRENKIITLYPNPSSGAFSITSNEAIESLKIYSIIGTLVYSIDNYNGNSIDLKTNPGIYLVRIKTDKHEYTKKLTIFEE